MAEYWLSLDPGYSTGWSHWYGDTLLDQGVVTGGLMGFIEWMNANWSWSAWPLDVLIVEDFIVEPSYVGIAWASEVKGAAIARIRHKRLVIQKRSDKGTLFHQRKKTKDGGEAERFNWLRDRGFSGGSHELDAITHVLVRKKRDRDSTFLRKYWPGLNEEDPAEAGPSNET